MFVQLLWGMNISGVSDRQVPRTHPPLVMYRYLPEPFGKKTCSWGHELASATEWVDSLALDFCRRSRQAYVDYSGGESRENDDEGNDDDDDDYDDDDDTSSDQKSVRIPVATSRTPRKLQGTLPENDEGKRCAPAAAATAKVAANDRRRCQQEQKECREAKRQPRRRRVNAI